MIALLSRPFPFAPTAARVNAAEGAAAALMLGLIGSRAGSHQSCWQLVKHC